jgi:hypothetical protein
MTMSNIDRMSWEEKLRLLEGLWDGITREGDRYESPAWHEQELKEPQQRYDTGPEESTDWATAKRDLRS